MRRTPPNKALECGDTSPLCLFATCREGSGATCRPDGKRGHVRALQTRSSMECGDTSPLCLFATRREGSGRHVARRESADMSAHSKPAPVWSAVARHRFAFSRHVAKAPAHDFAALGGGVEVFGELDQLFDHLHRTDGALSLKGARYASPGQRPTAVEIRKMNSLVAGQGQLRRSSIFVETNGSTRTASPVGAAYAALCRSYGALEFSETSFYKDATPTGLNSCPKTLFQRQ